MRTLLLTPWMAPHRIIAWERAVVLSFLGKVEVLETYDEELASPSIRMRAPAVVRLKKATSRTKQNVRFSRMNVYARDSYRCQYCGAKKVPEALNYDHVVPRVRGGQTTWTNIVTSCYACNDRKGSRTPEEAGMTLLRKPFIPKSLPLAPPVRVDLTAVPASWAAYCHALVGLEPATESSTS